ncbi:MAG TPA: hypothetical protein DCY88_30105 [Cyanobacteria bacterium UBA11372]|nr:hypothetical protein [Cyanobacteria bacterium UBA11372]HBE30100.1 hypothetical protein [Cyanobacteria bacterium UBA11368]
MSAIACRHAHKGYRDVGDRCSGPGGAIADARIRIDLTINKSAKLLIASLRAKRNIVFFLRLAISHERLAAMHEIASNLS